MNTTDHESMTSDTRGILMRMQQNEITEHHIYRMLSESLPPSANRDVLKRISDDELSHYTYWKGLTRTELKPQRLKVLFYILVSRLFGITFGIKLMERGETLAQTAYTTLSSTFPEAGKIAREEEAHEQKLIELFDEERLQYIGSMVLGLNDALVELTGTLAGLTFALQNTRLIAMAGLITGIAAALSMASSEYLSTKTGEESQNPLKASLYTGTMYILTVAFLITPYFLFSHVLLCLTGTLVVVICIIALFTFYLSVAKDLPFKKRFLEMAGISLGVALFTFFIGYLIRSVLHVDVD
ncbi:MAG TPA: VIT1/CCC1 transporter family protein [Elusimicrobiota bacterium]|nr:VIT1/CCC1 transporter family protein [Elusimicrobiota bacterium]